MALLDKYIIQKIADEHLKKAEDLANQLTVFRNKLLDDDKSITDKHSFNSQRSKVKGQRSTRGGFTLIELMVVAAIMILFTGGAIASIRAFHDRQILVQEAKGFKERLRGIQIAAQTGTQPTDGCTATYGQDVGMSSIRVNFTGSKSFTQETVCTNNAVIDTKSYTISSSSITYSVFPQVITEIEFYTLSRGVSNDIEICLTSVDGRNYKLEITSSGETNDLGLVSNCP